MKCLITGGTGFLGRHVVAQLLECKEDVTLLSRNELADIPFVMGDLSGPVDLGGSSFDVVYHVAGKAHSVPRTDEERRSFHLINTVGTKHLLTALERSPKLPQAVLLVSTIAVYGVEQGELLSETTSTGPNTPYGVSKLAAEWLLQQWCSRNNVRCAIVRLPLVAGSGAPGNLGAMVRALKNGRYLGIGNGHARRSMVRAEDVARILPRVAQTGGLYHLSDGDNPRLIDLECSLSAALGKNPPHRIPKIIASPAARLGSGVQQLTGLNMPITNRRLSKLSRTLTVSDDLARRRLGWRPTRVIDHVEEILT